MDGFFIHGSHACLGLIAEVRGLAWLPSPVLAWSWGPLFVGTTIFASGVAAYGFARARRERARREKAERAQRASEERNRMVLEGLDLGTWEHDLETGQTLYCERWHQLFGQGGPRVSIAWSDYLLRLHPLDRGAVAAAFEAHARGETSHYEKEYRMRCRDGVYRWVHSRGRVVCDARGRRVRMVGAQLDVTERKRAESALRASEERYRGLFERNPSPMFVFDRETLYLLEANEAALGLYGYARDEFLQMTILDLCDARTAARLEQDLASHRAWTSAEVWPHRRKDGAEIYVEVCVQPQEYAGRSGGIVVALDVTQRHLAEMRYRELFENATEGVYESSREGVFRSVNPAFARMLGYADPAAFLAAQIEGDRLYVAPGRWGQFLSELGDGQAVHDFESEVRCRDGSTLWIVENVRAVRGEDGAVRHFQGFVSNVTARRKADEALADERERLAVTLRAMVEGVITTDNAGVVRFINEAGARLTGWVADEAVGRRLADCCVFRREGTSEPIALPLPGGGESEWVLPPHAQLVTRSGGMVLVEGCTAVLRRADGVPMGMVLVLRDVSERARLEAEMVRASKLESLGLLAGGIAHDFNNLLTIIMGNVTLARIDSQAASSLIRWLAEAEKGVLRARDLTQQLLTFAKGGNPLRTTVLLQDVVREVAEFALHGSKVCCEYRIADDLRPANVDKGQIGQVVQNLVINAIQSMDAGGQLVIDLSNEQIADGERHSLAGGAYLRIAISDTGTGIAPEHLGHIFDPYFTTKAHGSGLGLATVYSIVKKHQGDLSVESVVGRGTTFRIWLPAAATMPAAPVAPALEPAAALGRVLFMDDEEPIRRLATALLKRMGHQVDAVGDGQSAVTEYERGVESGSPYDVVILDLTVPGGLGGLDVLRTLRKRHPEVLAIVSSGYSSDPVLADYRSFGFQGMIPKPYKLEDFSRVLNEVLGLRK